MGGQQDQIGVRFPEGISVGHWSDPVGQTGCTVILAPAGAAGGVDVRGGASGTLGTDALGRARSSTGSMWSCSPAAAPSAWPRRPASCATSRNVA